MIQYAHTRRVTVEFIIYISKVILLARCDCGYIIRESHACRHILDAVPTLEYFYSEYFESYFNFMYRNDKYTKLVEDYNVIFDNYQGLTLHGLKFNG